MSTYYFSTATPLEFVKSRLWRRSRGQVIDLFTKKSKTCPSDLGHNGTMVHYRFGITLCLSRSDAV